MFKPMLAPNDEVNLKELRYPLLASNKIDGVRGVFKDEQLFSRSLKSLPNIQINEKWEDIKNFCKRNGIALDGEFYSPILNFQQIVSIVMTENIYTKDSEKKWQKICEESGNYISRKEAFESLSFYVFDCVNDVRLEEPYLNRKKSAKTYCILMSDLIQYLPDFIVSSAEEVMNSFDKVVEEGFEGLILRNPKGRYKCGRATLKEDLIYKVKPFIEFDAKIINITQATVVDPRADKKTNELGRSVTSKKLEDRIPIERAKGFEVNYNGHIIEVPITKGFTHEMRDEVWKNKKKYIGQWLTYKGMLIGSKTVPRIPKFYRFRPDLTD